MGIDEMGIGEMGFGEVGLNLFTYVLLKNECTDIYCILYIILFTHLKICIQLIIKE